MNTATNPKTGEPLKKTKKVLIYGLSETETAQVQDNLPNADIEVMDCTGCFTDIIAHAYIAVIMNPDMLELDDIEYFNEFANDVGAYSEKIIFSKPHDILNRLNRNVRYVVFADAFDFQDKIKYVLLEASREDKRSNSYSDTVSQTIRVLSEIRKHPYISTALLAEIIERNPRTVQRYIATLVCAGEFIEYDKKKKGWFLYENKSVLWGDY
ncbi:MAG: HTH domain-containing protein [Eubacteriales bacterium]|nr:HTH domain-containing protein [Clostridiales bacterium]MDY2743201.1 HTH domain-containing protein [Eubacteriales bacterium]